MANWLIDTPTIYKMGYPTITLTPKYLFAIEYPATPINMTSGKNPEGYWGYLCQSSPPRNGNLKLCSNNQYMTVPIPNWNNTFEFNLVRYRLNRPIKLLDTNRCKKLLRDVKLEMKDLDGTYEDYDGHELIYLDNPSDCFSFFTIMNKFPCYSRPDLYGDHESDQRDYHTRFLPVLTMLNLENYTEEYSDRAFDMSSDPIEIPYLNPTVVKAFSNIDEYATAVRSILKDMPERDIRE